MATKPRKKRAARAPAKATKPGGSASRVLRWVLLPLGVAATGVVVFLMFVFPSGHGPGVGRDVELDMPADESIDALAGRLSAAGLVESPRLFALYVRLTGGAAGVVPGVHLVTDDLSPRELMARLRRSITARRVRLTIPEGWNIFDIGRRLVSLHVCTAKAWMTAVRDRALLAELEVPGDSAEGFLFPATYDVALDSDPVEIVRRMKGELDKRYAALTEKHASGLLDLESSLHWTEKDVLTLASMVEKEAAVDDERPTIASVFLNRLRDPSFFSTSGKYLQCDPTAGYGCLVAPESAPSCASYTGKITHDIVTDAANPYNTYRHEGLPPGPISNPGARSIEAVLAPSTTHYFYFVARGEGRHTFSETYAAHTAAVHGGAKAHPQATP